MKNLKNRFLKKVNIVKENISDKRDAMEESVNNVLFNTKRAITGSIYGFVTEEDGIGTVEMILILVVLIALVVIFKEQLTDLVNSIFDKITEQAGEI